MQNQTAPAMPSREFSFLKKDERRGTGPSSSSSDAFHVSNAVLACTPSGESLPGYFQQKQQRATARPRTLDPRVLESRVQYARCGASFRPLGASHDHLLVLAYYQVWYTCVATACRRVRHTWPVFEYERCHGQRIPGTSADTGWGEHRHFDRPIALQTSPILAFPSRIAMQTPVSANASDVWCERPRAVALH